ncbi:MBL fold metallo-hydrolase [Glycomyces albidus]|uniref:MBL fold metallo-hydrolase n=1 Tax=Glycomyces albidus TaxID=2656774 RepID=A0A6L5G5A4_9ACTN|nr:MBL fold metallo-hydrolase [Glycomyces albidus]MQM24818.1 MBL fold metallo-hydrolase [Glycomyces albidus]
MLIETVVADAFGTNCYVLSSARGSECVVVDPGIGVAARLDDVFEQHKLKPVAVLISHGHLDHTFSVTPVCGANDVPAYIHADDAHLLADPAQGFSANMMSLVGTGLDWTEPDDVQVLADGGVVELAGMRFTVDHAPGHTAGSAMFHTAGDEAAYTLTGDVLFRGAIGRTDLPGGSDAAMQETLRTKVLPLDDAVVVLPGHGPATTIAAERARNPYLKRAANAH